jgi:hypothetical protein
MGPGFSFVVGAGFCATGAIGSVGIWEISGWWRRVPHWYMLHGLQISEKQNKSQALKIGREW